LAVNLVGLWLLRGRHAESLNVRGAWLHLLGDTLGSVAAVAAAALVWAFGWNWADPAASAGIALLVIYSSWSLLRQSVAILMEASPGHMDVDQVRDALAALAGRREVHQLHVWAISSGIEVVSAHLVVEDGRPHDAVLREAGLVLSARFGIDHVTLQLEPADFHGRPAPP